MAVYIEISTGKISAHQEAQVTVTSTEDYFTAIECRAVLSSQNLIRGQGFNLLGKEHITDADGVYTLQMPQKVFIFTVSAEELSIDGNYKVGVFVLINEEWVQAVSGSPTSVEIGGGDPMEEGEEN